MYSEDYLTELKAGGDLLKQLKVLAAEYTGPCSQSMLVMQANQIKRQALLDAVSKIEVLQTDLTEAITCLRLLDQAGAIPQLDSLPKKTVTAIGGVTRMTRTLLSRYI